MYVYVYVCTGAFWGHQVLFLWGVISENDRGKFFFHFNLIVYTCIVYMLFFLIKEKRQHVPQLHKHTPSRLSPFSSCSHSSRALFPGPFLFFGPLFNIYRHFFAQTNIFSLFLMPVCTNGCRQFWRYRVCFAVRCVADAYWKDRQVFHLQGTLRRALPCPCLFKEPNLLANQRWPLLIHKAIV